MHDLTDSAGLARVADWPGYALSFGAQVASPLAQGELFHSRGLDGIGLRVEGRFPWRRPCPFVILLAQRAGRSNSAPVKHQELALHRRANHPIVKFYEDIWQTPFLKRATGPEWSSQSPAHEVDSGPSNPAKISQWTCAISIAGQY